MRALQEQGRLETQQKKIIIETWPICQDACVCTLTQKGTCLTYWSSGNILRPVITYIIYTPVIIIWCWRSTMWRDTRFICIFNGQCSPLHWHFRATHSLHAYHTSCVGCIRFASLLCDDTWWQGLTSLRLEPGMKMTRYFNGGWWRPTSLHINCLCLLLCVLFPHLQCCAGRDRSAFKINSDSDNYSRNNFSELWVLILRGARIFHARMYVTSGLGGAFSLHMHTLCSRHVALSLRWCTFGTTFWLLISVTWWTHHSMAKSRLWIMIKHCNSCRLQSCWQARCKFFKLCFITS